MLTQDDLKAIGQIVGERIDERVPKIVNDLVPPMLDELEGRMNVKFDAVQEQLDSIDTRLTGVEAGMVTKSYLDDKLAHYVPKPF